MRPIENADIHFSKHLHIPAAERTPRLHWHRRDIPFRLPKAVDPTITAYAEVNHGRWIVRCPFCSGAQFTSSSDPRFFCVDCGNEANGRRWVRVLWPPDVDAIEQVLLARSERCFMHWRPGETVLDLRAANAVGFHHSFTAYRTWVTGEVVTAAQFNEQIRDNGNEGIAARAVDAVLAIQCFG